MAADGFPLPAADRRILASDTNSCSSPRAEARLLELVSHKRKSVFARPDDGPAPLKLKTPRREACSRESIVLAGEKNDISSFTSQLERNLSSLGENSRLESASREPRLGTKRSESELSSPGCRRAYQNFKFKFCPQQINKLQPSHWLRGRV